MRETLVTHADPEEYARIFNIGFESAMAQQVAPDPTTAEEWLEERLAAERSAARRTVLDPASGSRMFYFDRADPRVLFGDIRTESHTLCDGRALKVAPDQEMDFRDLPHPNGRFRVVVFDPPHLTHVGEKSWMFKKYGGLNVSTWREDLAAGFAECFRVLADEGVLIFKWNETQIPVSQILALTPHKPLVGHKRVGKSADTHWITFLKAAQP